MSIFCKTVKNYKFIELPLFFQVYQSEVLCLFLQIRAAKELHSTQFDKIYINKMNVQSLLVLLTINVVAVVVLAVCILAIETGDKALCVTYFRREKNHNKIVISIKIGISGSNSLIRRIVKCTLEVNILGGLPCDLETGILLACENDALILFLIS